MSQQSFNELKTELEEEIESARSKLNEVGQLIGFVDADLLKLSQNLDNLIVEHMKLVSAQKNINGSAARTTEPKA